MTDTIPSINVKNRSAGGGDNFNKAPPGWSLTQPKSKWAWEKPPVHSSPAQAVDSIIDRLEMPEVRTQMEKTKRKFNGNSFYG